MKVTQGLIEWDLGLVLEALPKAHYKPLGKASQKHLNYNVHSSS